MTEAGHTCLSQALAAAQAEYPRIIKGSLNPHFRTSYADLADGMEPIRPLLAKHGIAYTQTFHVGDGGKLMLRTKLWHRDEQEISDIPIEQPPKPQEFVALSTYYRRVTLFAIAGITPADEDDDGESTAGLGTQQPAEPPRRTSAPPAEVSSETMVGELRALLATVAALDAEGLQKAKDWLRSTPRGHRHSRWTTFGSIDPDLRAEASAAMSRRAAELTEAPAPVPTAAPIPWPPEMADDPWELSGRDTGAFKDELLRRIEHDPWPEVQAAWAVYGPMLLNALTAAEIQPVRAAYTRRSRDNLHPTAAG